MALSCSCFHDCDHLADDLHDAKGALNDLTHRMHEMELELRRLENERDELTAAYKEAESVSKHLHSLGRLFG